MNVGINVATLITKDTIKPTPTPIPIIPELIVITASCIPILPGVMFPNVVKIDIRLTRKTGPNGYVNPMIEDKAIQKDKPCKRILHNI